MKKFNYENKQYLNKLDNLNISYYSKYIRFIKKYLPNKKSTFLDVGCGNGTVLNILSKSNYKNIYGIDISKLFIKYARSKGIKKVYYYNGKIFPFKDNFFDLVGSFNVLEHTENPEKFLKDQVALLKKGGHIITSCPNFLSVLFFNPHRKLRGIANKISNFMAILKKLFIHNLKFRRMKPLVRDNFEYDDDAIVITNMLDLKRILKSYDCTIVYESGFINFDRIIYRVINKLPMIKYMLPSCFIVARKN